MIGQDFHFTGHKRHILHRIGDGVGNPYTGPIRKICYIRRNTCAIFTKEKEIAIHNFRGFTEHIYFPMAGDGGAEIPAGIKIQKQMSMRQLSRKSLQASLGEVESNDEDCNENESGQLGLHLARSVDFDEEDVPSTDLDIQPTDIEKVPRRNCLIISDKRFCIHVLDLDSHRIVQRFGKGGSKLGEFISPTAVAAIHIIDKNDLSRRNTTSVNSRASSRGSTRGGGSGDDSTDMVHIGCFYFAGDSHTAQKIKVFDQDLQQIAQIGELGPALGQFRDILSLSCFQPSTRVEVKRSKVFQQQAANDVSINAAVAKAKAHPASLKAPPRHALTYSRIAVPSTGTALDLSEFGRTAEISLQESNCDHWGEHDHDVSGGDHNGDSGGKLDHDDGSGPEKGAAARSRAKAIAAAGLLTPEQREEAERREAEATRAEMERQKAEAAKLDSMHLHEAAAAALDTRRRRSDPDWYCGRQSMETLEEHLYDDNFHGNFLMGKREDIEDTYDLFHITRAKTLNHTLIKYNRHNLEFPPGYYIANSALTSKVPKIFPCLFDLVRSEQRLHHFTLGTDHRSFIYVAAVDKGNYRVQIFRFYWTKNHLFQPELQVAGVIGGPKKSIVELVRPTAATYTPTGELAVCDASPNKVYIFSSQLDVIKAVEMTFVSARDIAMEQKLIRDAARAVEESHKAFAKGNITSMNLGPGSAMQDYEKTLSKQIAQGFLRGSLVGDDLELDEEQEAAMAAAAEASANASTRPSTAATINSNSSLPGTRPGTSSNSAKSEALVPLQSSKTTSSRATTKSLGALVDAGTAAATLASSSSTTSSSTASRVVPLHKQKSSNSLMDAFKTMGGGGGSGSQGSGESIGLRKAARERAMKQSELEKEEKRVKGNRQACTLSVSQEGQLLVGYKSGGIYIYESYETHPMGALIKMQTKTLEYVICNFLTYEDIQALRNCCMYLHNFTKELRLNWKLFPVNRVVMVTRVVSLFVRWAIVDDEGCKRVDYPLRDYHGKDVCARHLRLECGDKYCPHSHGSIVYDREDLALLGAFIQYTDLIHFVGEIFDSYFLWRYELYIEALFKAYAHKRKLYKRHDPMTRNNEVTRTKIAEITRVLYFQQYLEIMTLLEEQFSGLKDIHEHKLFLSAARHHYVPSVDYSLDAIEKRIHPDLMEQYARPLDVPYKRSKGKKLITLKGMEEVERSRPSAKEEHVALFDCHSDKAAVLINRLFS